MRGARVGEPPARVVNIHVYDTMCPFKRPPRTKMDWQNSNLSKTRAGVAVGRVRERVHSMRGPLV